MQYQSVGKLRLSYDYSQNKKFYLLLKFVGISDGLITDFFAKHSFLFRAKLAGCFELAQGQAEGGAEQQWGGVKFFSKKKKRGGGGEAKDT